MNYETVIKAINNLDLKTLSLENVELLQKMVPTEQELKLYKDFVIEKKNINLLTEEDKFMLNLTKVERISSKLSIMNYMGNFFDSIHLISPVRLDSRPWAPFFLLIDSFLIFFYTL
jgi:formic-like protein